jgi:hypothetical protein
MTRQVKDRLLFEGKEWLISVLPLDRYFRSTAAKIPFTPPSTDCWRGYTGTWEIKDNRLFLTCLNAYIKGSWRDGMKLLFPGQQEIFAVWFNGAIILPSGNETEINPVSDVQLILRFRKGNLISCGQEPVSSLLISDNQ